MAAVPANTMVTPPTVMAAVPANVVVTPSTNERWAIERLCLVAQEHDTDGELETKLYKVDILPTSGGGAQVVFNDMECLKQSSSKTRKRTGPREETDQVDTPASKKTKRPRV